MTVGTVGLPSDRPSVCRWCRAAPRSSPSPCVPRRCTAPAASACRAWTRRTRPATNTRSAYVPLQFLGASVARHVLEVCLTLAWMCCVCASSRLQEIVQCARRVCPPAVDTSPSMPYWDVARHVFHVGLDVSAVSCGAVCEWGVVWCCVTLDVSRASYGAVICNGADNKLCLATAAYYGLGWGTRLNCSLGVLCVLWRDASDEVHQQQDEAVVVNGPV